MADLERLFVLVPPPEEPVDGDADWTLVEETLGLRLPSESLAVARRYGRGTFCDTFTCCGPETMIEDGWTTSG